MFKLYLVIFRNNLPGEDNHWAFSLCDLNSMKGIRIHAEGDATERGFQFFVENDKFLKSNSALKIIEISDIDKTSENIITILKEVKLPDQRKKENCQDWIMWSLKKLEENKIIKDDKLNEIEKIKGKVIEN